MAVSFVVSSLMVASIFIESVHVVSSRPDLFENVGVSEGLTP